MKLIINRAEDAISPREWDNFGTLFTTHKQYNFSDDDATDINPKTFKGVILPVYMYDHSSIILSTEPFSCPWDSGQIGVIYCGVDKIRKEFNCKRVTKQIKDKVARLLKGEIETLNQYVNGDVWGFTLYGDNEEIVDSCWGFFGDPDTSMQQAMINDHGIDPNVQVIIED